MANILSALILILSVLLLLLPYLPPALAGRLVGIGYGALIIIIANILATLLKKRWWRRVHLAIVVLSLPKAWAAVGQYRVVERRQLPRLARHHVAQRPIHAHATARHHLPARAAP